MKKLFLKTAIITATAALTLICSFSTVFAAVKAGDINRDGAVSIQDATKIQMYCSGINNFDRTQKSLADVNQDGEINVMDVTYLQKYLVGLVDTLPAPKPAADLDKDGYVNIVVRP